MNHELKIAAEFFDAVESGRKPFEVRIDDRGGFNIGDTLELVEVNIILEPSGRRCTKRVTYVLKGWGIERGSVCMGLASEVRVKHKVTCKLFPDPFDERDPVGPCTCGAEGHG